MAAIEIITVEKLAAILQRTIPTNDPSALYVVALANGLVTDVIGEDAILNTEMETITLDVAARAFTNPDGTSSVTMSFDDSSKTKRWEGGPATSDISRRVYLTDEERDRLGVLAGKAVTAGTIFMGTRFGVPCSWA